MTVANRIAERIVDAILACRLKPGGRLGENELGDLFGCSRTVVREALIMLSERGIVESSARRGWFIADPSRGDVEEAFRARFVIETGILRSTRSIDSASLRKIEEHIKAQKKAISEQSVGLRSLLLGDFHVHLARVLGHRLLAETLKNLTVRTTLSAMRYQSDQDASRSFAEHVAIVERLRAGDLTGAEALMAEHLLSWRAKLPVPATDGPRAELEAALRPVRPKVARISLS